MIIKNVLEESRYQKETPVSGQTLLYGGVQSQTRACSLQRRARVLDYLYMHPLNLHLFSSYCGQEGSQNKKRFCG